MRYLKFKESYAEKEENYYYKKILKNTIFIIVFCLILLLFTYLFIVKLNNFIIFLTFLLIILVSVHIIKNLEFESDYFLFQRYKAIKGINGEDEFFNVLKSVSDDYIVIQNYEIPEVRLGDIDFLLIGPKGIFIFEVKNYSGIFKIDLDDNFFKKTWYKYKFKKYLKLLKFKNNPLIQLLNQKQVIEKILKDAHINLPIYSNLIFVGGKVDGYISNHQIFILDEFHYKKFPLILFKMNFWKDYSEELENKILEVLKIDKTKIQKI